MGLTAMNSVINAHNLLWSRSPPACSTSAITTTATERPQRHAPLDIDPTRVQMGWVMDFCARRSAIS